MYSLKAVPPLYILAKAAATVAIESTVMRSRFRLAHYAIGPKYHSSALASWSERYLPNTSIVLPYFCRRPYLEYALGSNEGQDRWLGQNTWFWPIELLLRISVKDVCLLGLITTLGLPDRSLLIYVSLGLQGL